jgi:hypothetical protein
MRSAPARLDVRRWRHTRWAELGSLAVTTLALCPCWQEWQLGAIPRGTAGDGLKRILRAGEQTVGVVSRLLLSAFGRAAEG